MRLPSLHIKMGGSESKPINGDKANGDDEYHTPITNRRVQKLVDPRSPTDDVQRTPIQRTVNDNDVDFHDPRSPTVARTPVPDDSDPRSPSAGREPGPFVFPVSQDPRSPSRVVARTPICKDAPVEIGSSIETVTVHQSDTKETSDATSNNNEDSNTILKSSNKDEVSEPGVFQIDSDKENLLTKDDEEESQSLSVKETQQSDLVKSNPPEYEMELTKMVEKQTLANEESEDQDQTTLVLTDRETIFLAEAPPSPLSSSSKAKKHSIRRSLKETFSNGGQRSPLSTRNLLQDSPDPTQRPRMGVAYKKTGVRGRMGEGRQFTVQSIGRYQPVRDKENF